MVFDLTQNYAPDIYAQSRDYRVFLRQLGILTTVFKYNTDHFPDVYDADTCPEHLLPLLASMVGYKYNENKSVASNRKIIKAFPYLIRNRGSELGIKLATILSVNTAPYVTRTYSMENIVVSVDHMTGLISVYYPDVDVVDWELIEVVRPVGSHIKMLPSTTGMTNDEIDVKITVRGINRDETYDKSMVDFSKVSYDKIGDSPQ